jgi:predicted nucleic acid-binding protein
MDASTTLAGVFDDAADAFAVRAGDYVAEHGAIVPALWRWEVQNTLLTAMRRGRISEDQLLAARSLLAALPFKIDDASVLFGAELALARKHNLTAYDAAYLELALRADCKLATLDTALARAAEEYGLRFQ